MDTGWMPVIAAAIGGLIVLSGSWFSEYKRQLLEKRKLLIGKIEELYLLSVQLNRYCSYDLERSAKKIHNNDISVTNNNSKDVDPLVRSQMLTEIYFPSLLQDFNSLNVFYKDFYEFFAYVFVSDYSNSIESIKVSERERIEQKWSAVHNEITNFQKKITIEGNKIIHDLISSSFFVFCSQLFTRK